MSTEIIVPAVLAFITGFGLYKKVDIFSAFCEGAKEGLRSAEKILPALCFLMTAVGMLRQSGLEELFMSILSPFAERAGFPKEILPLAILRPFSGAGALALYEEILGSVSPGSFEERAASVLMGGSETTFYTLAVYYGAVGIKNGRNTVPAALSADIAAAILSVFAVSILFGR